MDAQTIGLTIAYTLCIFLSMILAFLLTNRIFKAKKSNGTVLLCLFSWSVVMGICTGVINNVPFVYVLTFIGGVVLLGYIFRFTMLQSYLCSCFMLFHLIALKGITIGTMSLVLRENSFMILENQTTDMISIIISQLLYVSMMYIYLRIVNVKDVRTFLLNKKQLSYTLICQLTITVFMLFNSFTFYYNLDLVWISIAQVLVGVILYFVFIIILNYGIKTADLIQHKIRDQKQLAIIQMQMRQQNSLLKISEIINAFKHDYRERTLVIEHHIEHGRYTEALKELKTDCLQQLAELPQTTQYSNNIILNSLLIDRQATCGSLNIHMEALLYCPMDICISEKEYHEVIRILTDNAIKANEKVAKNQRYLTIKSIVEGNWLSILMENPYEGIVYFDHDLPVSSLEHDDGDGMGLIYIKELMDEHHGVLHFEADVEKHVFRVSLLIPIDADENGGEI